MQTIFMYPMDQSWLTGYVSAAQEISAVKSRLGGFTVNNKGGATIFLQVFDIAPTGDAAAKKTAVDALVTSGQYREYPVYAGSYCPAAWAGGLRFHNGIYMRCVTAAEGTSTDLISGDDAKYDVSFMACW